MTPLEELLHYAPRRQHWFHSFEVAPGVWSVGHKGRRVMEAEMDYWGFPQDLSGKTVLDIGCADGGFSVEALKRGATSVLAIDDQQTTGMRLLNAAQTYPALEFRLMDLFSPEFMELPQFDFIIFAGVLYHVQDQLEALKRIRMKAGGLVMMETIFNETLGSSPPYAVFFETDEANGDPTNWWAPNFACLEGMLRTAGFTFEHRGVRKATDDALEGRVAYHLTPAEGSVFASVIDGATGSNSPLEEARRTIQRLTRENQELRARLGA